MAELELITQLKTPNITLAQPQNQPNITIAGRPAAQPQAKPGQVSKQQFAQAIKQKYPQYANQPDDKLADAFLAKYPEYSSKVAGGAAAPASSQSSFEAPEKPGLFKSIVQGIAKVPGRIGASVYNIGAGVNALAKGDVQKANEELGKSRDLGFLGNNLAPYELKANNEASKTSLASYLPTAQSALDVAGGGAELASMFVGGGAAKTTAQAAFKNALLRATLQGAKGGAISGGLYGLGSSLQDQENLGFGNTVTSTLTGAATGGLTGGVLGAGGTLLQRGFNKLAGRPLPPKPSSTGFLRSETGQGLMGTDVSQAAARLADDPKNVKAFQTGGKTFETIANTTRNAVSELESKSKAAFDAVKNSALTGKKFPKIATQRGALKGLPKVSELTPQEKPIVTKLRNLVMSNKDWSDNGLWALRNRIDRAGLFREGSDYISSNRAVNNARSYLNELITEGNPAMKQALDNATADIDFIGKLQASLIGRNSDVYVERTASNLSKIMNKLDDPTQFDATRKLIQELEDRTGISIIPDLEAAHAASVIKNKTEYPGLRNLQGTIGTFLNRRALGRIEKGALQRNNQKGQQKVFELIEQIRNQ